MGRHGIPANRFYRNLKRTRQRKPGNLTAIQRRTLQSVGWHRIIIIYSSAIGGFLSRYARIDKKTALQHADDSEAGFMIERDCSPAVPIFRRNLAKNGCLWLHSFAAWMSTHFNIDVASRAVVTFFTGTAPLRGGTTIIDHMDLGPNGCRLL